MLTHAIDCLRAQDQHINLVPTDYHGVASVFVHGATFVLQKHLEVTLKFEYKTDVNGLRGHIIPADAFDKSELLAILTRYGFTHTDYVGA